MLSNMELWKLNLLLCFSDNKKKKRRAILDRGRKEEPLQFFFRRRQNSYPYYLYHRGQQIVQSKSRFSVQAKMDTSRHTLSPPMSALASPRYWVTLVIGIGDAQAACRRFLLFHTCNHAARVASGYWSAKGDAHRQLAFNSTTLATPTSSESCLTRIISNARNEERCAAIRGTRAQFLHVSLRLVQHNGMMRRVRANHNGQVDAYLSSIAGSRKTYLGISNARRSGSSNYAYVFYLRFFSQSLDIIRHLKILNALHYVQTSD